MATRIVLNGPVVEAVYDDRFREIFQALGIPSIQRASDVEYEEATGEWIAIHRATGKIIARGLNRAQVIEDEISWLESNLLNRS